MVRIEQAVGSEMINEMEFDDTVYYFGNDRQIQVVGR